MDALKVFGSPWLHPQLLFSKLLMTNGLLLRSIQGLLIRLALV